MTDGSDDDLMLLAGRGDRNAFARLVDGHFVRAMAVAGRVMGNRSDAEEIVQEAFLRAWRKSPDWAAQADRPGGARFSTWLYRVVVNLCIDRKRRPATAPLDDAATVADTGPTGFDHTARNQTAEHVARAVARLPARQRAALVLCYYEHMSNLEAAAILGVSVGALESLLVRARKRLRGPLAHMRP